MGRSHSLIIPFWGISDYFPSWFPDTDRYLVSAASLWWASRGKFVCRSYPFSSGRMFLDSGGFKFFSQAGDYPFSPDEYLRLVCRYRPLCWAALDYPCEPTINRSVFSSNRDRIEATLDHLAYLFPRDNGGLVPVVQGYSLDERLWCLEQILSRGLSKRLMAIGSLCVFFC